MFVIACILSVAIIWILKGTAFRRRAGTRPTNARARRARSAQHAGRHHWTAWTEIFSGGDDLRCVDSGFQSDGLVSAVHVANCCDKRDFRARYSPRFFTTTISASKRMGLFGHLKHLAGPIWWIAPLIFPIELISNFIRPFSLGIRLFGNMFADEKVVAHRCRSVSVNYALGIARILDAVGHLCGVYSDLCFHPSFTTLLERSFACAHDEHAEHGHELRLPKGSWTERACGSGSFLTDKATRESSDAGKRACTR